jgi:hypothetical protein
MLLPGSMKSQHSARRSPAVIRHATRDARRLDPAPVRVALVPQIVTFGILAGATTAFAGGAKGIIQAPPDAPLLYFIAAVTFFVVGALMWFVLRVFSDARFTRADPRIQVKLAREALAPVIQLLGGLQKAT